MAARRAYNGPYRGEHLTFGGFPLGGLGAGMIAIDGAGRLTQLAVRNKPDLLNEPFCFAAVCVKGASGNVARVLEGPIPRARVLGMPGAGNGGGRLKTYGLPRMTRARMLARFPFATVSLDDPALPVRIELTAWSPFIPGDADNSSLPVAALEYRFRNVSVEPVEMVFSYNSRNLMAVPGEEQNAASVGEIEGGFLLRQKATEEKPWNQGDFCIVTDAPDAAVNCHWFRGGWFDPQTMAWKDIQEGRVISRPPVTDAPASPGASLYVPLRLAPRETRTVRVMLSWYCPESDMRYGPEPQAAAACGTGCGCAPQTPSAPKYRPWYAGRFSGIEETSGYWRSNYRRLRAESLKFSHCFYDSTLPPEVVEAVTANLTILKSPTCLRQDDGRFWGWEGCGDQQGCCSGSCTHVWNYAQAMCHLFPALERTMRETEFLASQDDKGHQAFRASLPVREAAHDFHAAADGQLGGIMKAYRDWRISGDTAWLKGLWPRVRTSMQYCIDTWDPDRTGTLREPHHNTYDIEFWGADAMCTSFYLGALAAMVRMAEAFGEDATPYRDLLQRGRDFTERELFDGEYFIQKVQWQGLHAPNPAQVVVAGSSTNYSPDAVEMLKLEGPKYQYAGGCLSDGILGVWMAACCGLPGILDPAMVRSHLLAVHRHNLKRDLSAHANPQRPTYALGDEGGLLLCTWPKGGKPSIPFVYSEEVWTGIEYQAAAHLMMMGRVDEGCDIVRTARDRYDGRLRNPFDEYECGHWYARAMSSYSLLQALSGARYDAVDRILHLHPRVPGDFRAFLCTATGYGVVGVKDGRPFFDVRSGKVDLLRIDYQPCS